MGVAVTDNEYGRKQDETSFHQGQAKVGERAHRGIQAETTEQF